MPTVTLTQHNFHSVVAGNNIVLIDWWAGWCGPCTHFAPVYEDSSERHPELVYGKVDVEAEIELTALAQVDRFPTLMAFREGLLVFNQAGFLPAADLEEVVQQIMWMDMDAVRRATAEAEAGQVAAQPPAATNPQRLAGQAAGPARYGWPGL
ncbi:thioredoxin family protein [Nocardia goodfellowii]|uniref:Thioredoxin 1 n=1 Tax=Nocardia goodfellowii TaxID=882446 RepID=A0ABS4QLU7_9NOCA|nr:thioredoxin domain-containing protein [Nocardia goodfellowii]MBP2192677.1 thioredoxin 1 [Nocardia goodfellowii]